MSALLEVRDLRSGYGRIPILFGLDMTVQDGEYLGILGHNGMGKTTTLRALMGHLPTTGAPSRSPASRSPISSRTSGRGLALGLCRKDERYFPT